VAASRPALSCRVYRRTPMPQRVFVLTILALVATEALGRSKVRAAPTRVDKLCAFCTRPPCFWDSPSAVAELQALLVSSKAEVLAARDRAKHSAMNIAAFHLNVEGVKALIAAGADASNPDKNGHRPLHHTVISKQGGARPGDQKAIVEALMTARADSGAKDVSGKTPADLCGASKHGACGPAVTAALRSTSSG
jgi:ankyrin repeat protein